MSGTPKELSRLSKALELLQEARSLQEVLDLHDKAQAVSRYTQQADYGKDIIGEASVIKLIAERRLGKLLAEMSLPNAAPGNQYTGRVGRSRRATGPPGLKKLGISKSRSSRSQQIANLPKPKFDAYISDAIKSGKQPTVAGALKIAKQHQAAERAKQPRPPATGFVSDLQGLIDDGRTFPTIVADPPWKYDNHGSRASASDHYPTMSVDDICSEPVAKLAARDCHLHLWATSPLLPEALTVMKAWGFQYKASFVWTKPQMGIGNYWRISHEFLLFGVRGELAFLDHAQRSWLEAKRTSHSTKPKEIQALIETVSPGPYLEMYGRRRPPNTQWTVCGNQLNDD